MKNTEKGYSRSHKLTDLREKAKKVMASLNSQKFSDKSQLNSAQLLEELNIYYIELEMQNDELQESRDKLEASLKYQSTLFGSAPIGYVVMSDTGDIQRVNETYANLVRIGGRLLIGKRFHSFVTQTLFLDYNACLNRLFQEGTPQHVEVQLMRTGHPPFWARLDFTLLTGIEGTADKPHVLCSVVDISDEKKAQEELVSLNEKLEERVAERTRELQEEIEERKEAQAKSLEYAEKQKTLIREIHHRVKNNMQIVVSLLKLQSKKITNEDALVALGESQNRIRALAMIHEILYQSEDLSSIPFKQYLNKLSRHIAIAYSVASKGVRFNANTQVTSLHIDQAVPVGLIITELVSNAIKYAFPDNNGEVSVKVKPYKKNQCELIVWDNGVGFPPNFDIKTSETLGLRLTCRLAQDQLNGSIEIIHNDGTEIIIRFPLKQSNSL